MCGRYTLYEADHLDKRYNLAHKPDFAPKDNYNAAPRQLLPVVFQSDDGPAAALMQWGFLPFFAKDPAKSFRPINTVSETAFDKPMWREAVKHHRALVPARGFYEWVHLPDGHKQPYYIHPKDVELFSFAGLYSIWRNAEGLPTYTFSILTTEPNKEMGKIHSRMPVILDPGQESDWLDPARDDKQLLLPLMMPYHEGGLDIYRVSEEVNSPKHNEPSLLKPVA